MFHQIPQTRQVYSWAATILSWYLSPDHKDFVIQSKLLTATHVTCGDITTWQSSTLELAKELTLALIQTGNVAPEDMQETLQKTYATLTALKAQEESGVFAPAPVSQTVPVDWRKSITKHAVTCLECGQAFKQLSLRHLGIHGLDSGSYRTSMASRRPSHFPPERPQSGGVRLSRRYAPGRRRRTFFKRRNIMATHRLSRTQKLCLKQLKRQSYPHRYSRNGNGQRHQRRKPRAKQAGKSRDELVSTKKVVCCKKKDFGRY